MLEILILFCMIPIVISQPRIVLALDTSQSMEDSLETLGLALFEWFEQIPDDVLVGMVAFSTDDERLSDLTTSREQLKNNFPYQCDGESCIGCGIRGALQVLGHQAYKGVIVLITDGDNTEPGGDISDVQGEVEGSGATVVAVGIGDEAPVDKLEGLASATGGLFFAVERNRQPELLNCLNKALQLAQKIVNPTTTTTELVESKVSFESMYNITSDTNDSRYLMNVTKVKEKQQEPHLPFWLIVGVAAAGLGALLLMIIVLISVWRRLFMPRTNGFYQVAYSRGVHKT